MTDAKNEAAGGASRSDAVLGADAKPERRPQYCTFCGARDDEVQLLIACYAAMICDNCVQICNEILTEKEIPLMAQATEVPNV
ncbi:MAG: ClpX C4-type zinc finger protein [Thiobacillus sp.]|nr:ClpX C4-type zinc finger protein [Thiobacillus sp.]